MDTETARDRIAELAGLKYSKSTGRWWKDGCSCDLDSIDGLIRLAEAKLPGWKIATSRNYWWMNFADGRKPVCTLITGHTRAAWVHDLQLLLVKALEAQKGAGK